MGSLTIDWPEIVRDHGPVVWKTVNRLLNHDADAADCFQETFVNAMKVSANQPIQNWPGLLRRLATARALDVLRRRIRQRRIVGELHSDLASSGSSHDPVGQTQACELKDRLREALAELSPEQSQLFCLRFLSEMSYEEISKELGLSIDAVGVKLHRARAKLRELLSSFAEQKRS